MAEVTNKDLYDAINNLRSEFSGAIQRMDDKFGMLEAGRITRAELAISKLEIREATLSTKVYFLVAGISGTVSIITALVAAAIHK